MKKRLFAALLAAVMVVSMMATTVFAVELEEGSASGKEVYSVTLDADQLATGGSRYEYVTNTLSLGGYQNGWSAGADANFSTLPANAIVESIEIAPGRLSAGSSTTSPITTTKYAITSPRGKTVERTFKNTSEILSFYGDPASGHWTFQIYGTNVGPSYGSVKCSSTKITLWYTLE